MPEVHILFASISGRTRKVASELAKEFSPLSVEVSDFRDGLQDLTPCKLFVFGSPTYGIGDWHHLWEKWSPGFADCDLRWSSQAVSIFVLGDAKHHPESFAGAMLHLRDLVSRLGAQLIGQMPYDETYNHNLCRTLLADGYFPGLVLDHVSQRRLSEQRIRSWVKQLKSEAHFPDLESTV